MHRLRRLVRGRTPRLLTALVATTALLASCQPGWTKPFAGTGSGNGTTPGPTSPANTGVGFQTPANVVATPGGGFYLYDSTACAVYRVDNSTTGLYAGTPGSCGDSGDDGPADLAQIDANVATAVPTFTFMALDGGGNLYVSGQNGRTLRRIDATTQTITSVTLPTDPSNGLYLTGLAADADGSIVFQTSDLDTTTEYRLDGAGAYATLFHASDSGFLGLTNTGPGQFVATSVQRHSIERLDVDAGTLIDTGVAGDLVDTAQSVGSRDGAFYAAGVLGYADAVVRIDPDNSVTLVAGTGTPDPGTTRQRGVGTALDLSPMGLAVTPNHGLLVSSGHVVYRVDHPEQAIQPADVGVARASGATLDAPGPLVASTDTGADAAFYVADTQGCVIRKVQDGQATIVAGNGTCGDTGDGGPATDAQIDFAGVPTQLGLDGDGNLYFIQDVRLATGGVRMVAPDGVISTVSGTQPTGGRGLDGLVVDPDGTLTLGLVDNASSGTLLRRTPQGAVSTLTTYPASLPFGLAALGGDRYAVQDATGTSLYRIDATTGAAATVPNVQMGNVLDGGPGPVATADGTIYAATDSDTVVRIDPDDTVTVIAGNGSPDPGTRVQGGFATQLALSPTGLAITPDHALLISSGHTVYRLDDPNPGAAPSTTTTIP